MPTALISVSNKTGIVEFAAGLSERGWRIVSTGGTAAGLRGGGVAVTQSSCLDCKAAHSLGGDMGKKRTRF